MNKINRIVILGLVAVACLLTAFIGYRLLDVPLPVAPGPVSAPAPQLVDGTAGRLAYIGGDGNVYVTTPDRGSTIAVTRDATTSPEGRGLSYHRISWSPEGWLAFAAVTRAANDQTSSKLYVAKGPGKTPKIVTRSDSNFVIYMSWSPVPCPAQPACRRLAYLIEADDSLALRLVDVAEDHSQDRHVGLGRPFYFSWSPDGRRLVWHTGGARRYNEAARLAAYDVDLGKLAELPQAPGLFLAPAWSPQGDSWLGVMADDGLDQLQRVPVPGSTLDSASGPVTLTAASDSQIVFSWSPAGDQVAFAVRSNSNAPFYGPVHIFDTRTGQVRRVTDVGFHILGFFWAPDGQRLAYLIRQALPDTAWMQWRVYDLVQNSDRGFKAFNPSAQMRSVIGSFNQYTQSHRFWSPDGRYLVYADRTPDLIEQVWLIDTWHEDGTNSSLVGEGTIGFWSWHR